MQLETPPEDVINTLEADLVGCVAVGHQGASRRVVLVPQSSQGTPRSIQDRESQPCGSGRLLTRMENDVTVEGDEGGSTQASLGVQGLHVVNIADDSDEEFSLLETQSRPRRLRLTWREIGWQSASCGIWHTELAPSCQARRSPQQCVVRDCHH